MSTSTYSANDQARFVQERHQGGERDEFSRDRDRIIHCSAFRRLAFKTQVLTSGSNDFTRTRLTHTLEVAQIGRQIARMLERSQDLVEAACLAHDLGHPPFGHWGESVLNDLVAPIGGFEGNAQTFRILTRLEPKFFLNQQTSVGLNLTRATLDAVIKYPWSSAEKTQYLTNSQNPKFNYYLDDAPIFTWTRQDSPSASAESSIPSASADLTTPPAPPPQSMEAQIMDYADDVSYCVHDFEDGYAQGLITYEQLNGPNSQPFLESIFETYPHDFSAAEFEQAYQRLVDEKFFSLEFDASFSALAELKSITSALIGRFTRSATYATIETNRRDGAIDANSIRYQSNLIVPLSTRAEILLLKSINYKLIMENDTVVNTRKRQTQIIEGLFEYFQTPAHISGELRFFYDQAENDNQRLRVIIDQIASLTDHSAQQIYFSRPKENL
jgi:dGTPase